MDNTDNGAAAVRRSACDQCRAKRVRCLRAENSTVPCARCSHMGVRCVTGAPGHPGRPRKPRLFAGGDGSTPRDDDAAASPAAAIFSPGRSTRASSALRDTPNPVELHAPAMPGAELEPSKPSVHPPRGPLAHGPHPDFWDWEATGDSGFFMDTPSTEQSPAPGKDVSTLMDQLSRSSQLQGLPSADDDLNAILHMDPRTTPDMDMDSMNIDPLLDPWQAFPRPPSPLPQCVGAASSLMRFREDMVQRIAALHTYFSDPLQVMQSCLDEGEGAGNPAAVLLTCSKEFIDIIQSLTPEARPQSLPRDPYPNHHQQLVPPDLAHMHPAEDALSTEVLLLALSGYLALMRLYDSLFHCIYTFLCQMPPDSFKALKVKSVLRIGGISSLQDAPLKTYATGILDVVRGQVRTLERCLGISAEYCLSGGDAPVSLTATTAPGIFSRADRARLFCEVMAQEDVKARRGGKSYVESIRASIRDSMVFLED